MTKFFHLGKMIRLRVTKWYNKTSASVETINIYFQIRSKNATRLFFCDGQRDILFALIKIIVSQSLWNNY